ncbi:hypothetical protein MMC11_003369 [Xylographa trunciseda]|nr:hypothetical protein [Xylographa trunciseda]
MPPSCTDADKRDESVHDGDVEARSADEDKLESQSTFGNINDENDGQEDVQELSEDTGKLHGKEAEETGAEGDSDEETPPELREGMPLEDDGVFEEEGTFLDSEEVEGYGPEPGDGDYGWGTFGSESEDDR